jgi:hypothetical protein
MMDRKGQRFTFIGIIFVGLFFLVMFAVGLAPMVSSLLGGTNLTSLGTGGAWIAGNLNVWFFIAFIIAIFGLIAWGLNRE